LIWSLLSLVAVSFVFLKCDVLFKLIYGQMPLFERALILPLIFILVTLVTVWSVSAKRFPSKWVAPLFIIIIAGDLIITGWSYITVCNASEFLNPVPPLLEKVENPSEGSFRAYFHDSVFPPNRGMLSHIENLNGSTPLALKRTIDFMEAMTGVQPFRFSHNYIINRQCFMIDRPFPFRILNVRYSMTYDDESGEAQLLENVKPFPRAIWIQRAEVLSGPEAVLERLSAEDFDPRLSVLLEEDPGISLSRDSSIDSAAPAKITDYQNNRIAIECNAPGDGWLLLSEQFYPGWKAWCDGSPAPIYRADYILRAVPVPGGKHTIVMKYSPPSFKIGAALSALMALMFCATVAVSAWRARNPGTTGQTHGQNK
jgi:hypothetical protein